MSLSGQPTPLPMPTNVNVPVSTAPAIQRTPTKRPTIVTSMTNGTASSQRINEAKDNYRILKKRFKFLVYENECYQEEIRNLQRKLLKLSRDKNFLLDRLLQYEKLSDSSDDSDASIARPEEKKAKKKPRPPQQRNRNRQNTSAPSGPNPGPTSSNVSTPMTPTAPGLPIRGPMVIAQQQTTPQQQPLIVNDDAKRMRMDTESDIKIMTDIKME